MTRRLVRPLWIIGIAWLIACLIGVWVPAEWLWYIAAALFLCFVAALLIPEVRAYHTVLLALIAAVTACLLLAYCELVRYQPLAARVGEEIVLRAEVDTTGTVTELRVLSGDLPTGTRLLLWSEPTDAALDDHDIVEAVFVLKTDEVEGLSLLQTKASGVWFAVTPVDMSAESWVIESSTPTLTERIADQRDVLSARIQRMIAGDIGAVVTGICLGADEWLSDDAVAAFRSCGVSHLFAVSGLHLSILTTALLRLLKRLRIPRRVRGAITVSVVTLFAVLVGWTPSVTRAGVLCLLVTLGDCARRQADARNSLGLALFLLLLENPFAAYDAGLLLSFFATFGVLFLSPAIQEMLLRLPLHGRALTVWKSIAGMIGVTLSATLTTLPITVIYFGSVSLVGILANVLMTVPASALLVLGWLAILSLLAGLVVLYRPLLLVVGWLSKLLLGIAKLLSGLPLSTVTVRSVYLIVWLFGSALLVLFGYRLLYRRGIAIAATCAVVVLGVGMVLHHTMLRDTVRMYAVPGQEELAVCVLYDGQAVVVTAPEDTETLYAIRSSLREQGVSALDTVFLPSGNNHAVAYVPAVLEEYLADAALCEPTEETVALWDVGSAAWQDNRLCFTFGEVSIAFDADSTADCVFTGGAITLYRDGEPYTINEENGELPWLWIRDGDLHIK